MAWSIVLGLLAAAVFAGAAAVQHRANRSAALRHVHTRTDWGAVGATLRLLPRLLRSPLWLAGLLGNVVGFLLHSAALHFGDLAVIQAVLVTQLLFALPLAAVRTGAAPLLRDWLGTASVCGGIAVLLLVRGERQPPPPADSRVLMVAGLGVAIMSIFIYASRRWDRFARLRTVLLGLAAGTGFSITATFILATGDRLSRLGFLGLLDWPTVGLGMCGVVTSILVQSAFGSGALPAALTAMTVADPLASWLWSLLFFDTGPLGVAALGGYVAAAVLLAAGTLVLAYSPTRAAADLPLQQMSTPVSPATAPRPVSTADIAP
jgi:hypothetical protein